MTVSGSRDICRVAAAVGRPPDHAARCAVAQLGVRDGIVRYASRGNLPFLYYLSMHNKDLYYYQLRVRP
jgi:hypothetical protein